MFDLTDKNALVTGASGGIGGLLHLTQLYEAGVQAAVCGRALYEERFTLEAAIAACGGIA